MKIIAQGFNSFETKKAPEGDVIYLPTPQSVIKLIQSGKLKQHILLVQGGTTTFLSPALSMGALGVITLSGAPESHLGILSREFQMPCVMTTYLVDADTRYVTSGDNTLHFNAMIEKLQGKRVKLDCSGSEHGKVLEVA
ncbi:PEP-utilizing enzyme [Xanthobacter oligotrophicus]|uniref:PEP-utilizing enzyme n=1 Tax=Xanthobacter oligotrophicus TaxID=2607286 RepID=UPI0011F26F86|nr:PEP-utilizing enzyme [Xanthobacter oligotrophicus]MCG5237360.1 PEP-utilizing enzyme [Xanthobacter oligotrophicus]